ncbi:MAG TPA: peptide chain release factor-like protein, partial [Myxococcota bacterium]|nr:peptide chain release factor-like protein [Myxococcota bacterium]
NKVATCVILLHRPTGTLVRCEQERSQGLNRYLARKRLVDKIEQKILGDASTQRQAIEKIRRQKRKRSARAKEKMLRDKKIRSEVKELRKPVDIDEE